MRELGASWPQRVGLRLRLKLNRGKLTSTLPNQLEQAKECIHRALKATLEDKNDKHTTQLMLSSHLLRATLAVLQELAKQVHHTCFILFSLVDEGDRQRPIRAHHLIRMHRLTRRVDLIESWITQMHIDFNGGSSLELLLKKCSTKNQFALQLATRQGGHGYGPF